MANQSIKTTFRILGKKMSKHSPTIATVAGIGFGGATVYLAVKETPKALKLIEEKKRDIREETGECVDKLNVVDTVKTTWKCYLPAFTTGVISVLCIAGANSIHARRNAALIAAYKLSESSFLEYKGKVLEAIGEKKEKSVREAVAQAKLDKDPVTNKEVFITEKGETLCYDALSGRYFKSDQNQIEKAVNNVNRSMINHNSSSLNYMYYELGLDGTTLGNDLGWNIDMGTIKAEYHAILASDGTPCLAVEFDKKPVYDYDLMF